MKRAIVPGLPASRVVS